MSDLIDLKAKTTHTKLRAAKPLTTPKLPDSWSSFLTLTASLLGLGSLLIGFWILMLGVLQLVIPSLAYLAYDSNQWLLGIEFFIGGIGLILTSFGISKYNK
jgi:hypothetical protein